MFERDFANGLGPLPLTLVAVAKSQEWKQGIRIPLSKSRLISDCLRYLFGELLYKHGLLQAFEATVWCRCTASVRLVQ